MGPGSLVVLASYTGTTKETVAAAKTAKAVRRHGDRRGQGGQPAGRGRRRRLRRQERPVRAAGRLLPPGGRRRRRRLRSRSPPRCEALPEAVRHACEESESRPGRHRRRRSRTSRSPTCSAPARATTGRTASRCASCRRCSGSTPPPSTPASSSRAPSRWSTTTPRSCCGSARTPSRPMAERGKAFLDTYCKKAKYVDVADLTLPGVPRRCAEDLVTDRRRRPRQPAGPALRGRARPRPGDAPVHVQGRLLIPDGPALRTPADDTRAPDGVRRATHSTTRSDARKEPSCSTSTNSDSCASSPVRCPSPTTSTRPSAAPRRTGRRTSSSWGPVAPAS